MAEKLRLVTSWSELQPGVLVTSKIACYECGGRHRGIVLSPCMHDTIPAWLIEPNPHPGEYKRAIVSKSEVVARRVYRVLDGLDPAADAEQERKELVTDAAANMRRAMSRPEKVRP